MASVVVDSQSFIESSRHHLAQSYELIEAPDELSLTSIFKDSHNPFLTSEFARAREASGFQTLLLSSRVSTAAHALAFLRRGRFHCIIEMPSMPSSDTLQAILPVLLRYAKRNGVTSVTLNSFGSQRSPLPNMKYAKIKDRMEFILTSESGNHPLRMSDAHRRNARKAEKGGVELRTGKSPEHLKDHGEMGAYSLARRASRGGECTNAIDFSWLEDYRKAGCVEFFQAYLGDECLSSVAFLLSPHSSYFFSSGTSAHGMKIGASQYLVSAAYQLFMERGLDFVNLGGSATSDDGLIRFKSGFGAEARTLSSVKLDTSSTLKKLFRFVLGPAV
jgi:hypothetical protein